MKLKPMMADYPFLIGPDEFGKQVLVTGGIKGIGQAIVRPFLERCFRHRDGALSCFETRGAKDPARIAPPRSGKIS